MNMLALAAFAAVPLLSACAGPGHEPVATARAVALVPGTRPDFAFVVENVGSAGGTMFLNSIEDYRDARCITVAIKPGVLTQLKARYGDNLESAFRGRRVYVHGARVELVGIEYQARPLIVAPLTYRTQVMVGRADEIDLF